jgi:hypothetical protein
MRYALSKGFFSFGAGVLLNNLNLCKTHGEARVIESALSTERICVKFPPTDTDQIYNLLSRFTSAISLSLASAEKRGKKL